MKKCGSEPLPYPLQGHPEKASAPAPKNALPRKREYLPGGSLSLRFAITI